MVKDPVCHLDVDERSAWYSVYRDKTYYFSSSECKAEFDRDPAKYVAHHISTPFRAKAEKATGEVRSRVQTALGEQKGVLSDALGMLTQAFRGTARNLRDEHQDKMAAWADKAAERADNAALYLKEKNVDEILNQAETFIRRRPGLIIGSAFATGFLMTRLLKSARPVSA